MTQAPFSKKLIARFRQADPAGILFFGQAYEIAHDAFEDFVGHLGLSWKDWFENQEWATPIRHSECDHLAPLRPGHEYTVGVRIDAIGESSLCLRYVISDGDRTCAEVKLVHAFLNRKTFSKLSIPSDVRSRLEAYQSQSVPTE